MPDPVSVIVPARNEADTIARVITGLLALPRVAEVVVADNGSTDATARAARHAGARVVPEPRAGMGHAVRTAVAAAHNPWVMKVDADLDRFDLGRFAAMAQARGPGVGLVKGNWTDPGDDMPMTRLLVAPAIRQIYPGLAHLQAPNSGIYLFDKRLVAVTELTGSYAVDLDVMIRVHAAGSAVAEVAIGHLAHDRRSPQHYAGMAETLLAFFLDRAPRRLARDWLVLADAGDAVARHVMGAAVQHLRAGGAVTLCLDDPQVAPVLAQALAAFPTARVLPLEAAGQVAPRHPDAGLRVLAPHPGNGPGGAALALARARRLRDRRNTGLLLMPPPDGAGFHPDTHLPGAEGAALKRAVLTRLGVPAGSATAPLPPEMAQTA